jgi:1-hydroxycarotenoid 3,4-desaturase
MPVQPTSSNPNNRVIVVGAGIAGLATAARLAHAGRQVIVLEKEAGPGGKMRTLPSPAGPVDAGPTVLTMRSVFDDLFRDLDTRLDDHLSLHRHAVLARHFWKDGSSLDLHGTEEKNYAAILAFAGSRAAEQFLAFNHRACQLFNNLQAPMLQTPDPSIAKLASHFALRPRLLPSLARWSSLDRLLKSHFDDPRLIQLFGRYATYVGGSPYRSPALLALIWQAEASGVWSVDGGMYRLAQAVMKLAASRGARFLFETRVKELQVQSGRVTGVVLGNGRRISAGIVVFNGDPRALSAGLMGPACEGIARQTLTAARSLSAEVWAFAARAAGPDLAYHNVFFSGDPEAEFRQLEEGKPPEDPTVYVCAMDRMGAEIPANERFETIVNAPPVSGTETDGGLSRCLSRTFRTLEKFGLRFNPEPERHNLTTPAIFDRLFPGSTGSLYGQSPHGLTAALKRPQAKTPIRGLYLAGGGTHPGAGVPMAVLSARHAAEAILTGRTSTSSSRRTATRGGTLTA